MSEVKRAEPRPPTFAATLGMLLAGALLLLAAIHVASADGLLFHSDAWSLTVYFGATGAAFLPLLAVLAFATGWGRRLAPRCFGLLHGVYTLFLVTAILIVLLVVVAPVFGGSIQRFLTGSAGFAVAAGMAAVLALVHRRSLVQRIERLGIALLAAVVAGVPAMIACNHLGPRSGGPRDDPPRHLVMIVLDRLPSHLLRAYSPNAAPSPWDDVLRQGHLMRGMQTVAPYTHRFFGSLYTGKHAPQSAHGVSSIPNADLWSTLQHSGVQTRWLSDHRNGTPEGSEARLGNYRGLRSLLLTEKYAWWPRLLGLDYCVMLNSPTEPMHGWRRFWRDIPYRLNGKDILPYDNVLLGCLLPQLREMQRGGRNSFTLFHASWQFAVRNRGQRPVRPGHDALRTSAEVSADYRYEPSLEPLVTQEREATIAELASAGESLAEFLTALREDDALRDTTVLVTADHGCMFEKGRLRYVFHPNQEAIKVLCAIFEPGGKPQVDDRFFSTPDLSAGILDYFGIGYRTESGAQSLFGSEPGRDWTLSLTARNNVHHEWWLVVVGKQTKYCFNLHPHGSAQAVAYKTDSFDQIEAPLTGDGYRHVGPPRDSIPAIRDALARSGTAPSIVQQTEALLREHATTVGVGRDVEPVFRDAVGRYGIGPGDIHPVYRAMLPQKDSPERSSSPEP